VNKFVAEKHSTSDKSFQIKSPKGMEIYIQVDFDDVWHPVVNKETKAIVKVLNNHLDELKKLMEK
jgi:hypothetical protein